MASSYTLCEVCEGRRCSYTNTEEQASRLIIRWGGALAKEAVRNDARHWVVAALGAHSSSGNYTHMLHILLLTQDISTTTRRADADAAEFLFLFCALPHISLIICTPREFYGRMTTRLYFICQIITGLLMMMDMI